MFGNVELATAFSDCAYCPEKTYNDLEGQKACRPCGSSATAPVGSSMCSCIGKYRYYQPSYGKCVCLNGYIYYNEVDVKEEDGNGDENCQQIVDSSCSTTEARWANDRSCINPKDVDCNARCSTSNGGTPNIDMGM